MRPPRRLFRLRDEEEDEEEEDDQEAEVFSPKRAEPFEPSSQAAHE
jgi:hypothetical protein